MHKRLNFNFKVCFNIHVMKLKSNFTFDDIVDLNEIDFKRIF